MIGQVLQSDRGAVAEDGSPAHVEPEIAHIRPPPDRPRSRTDDQLGSIEVSSRERVEAALQPVDESRSRFGTKSSERVIDEAGEIGLSQLGELVRHPASRIRRRAFPRAFGPSANSPRSASSRASLNPCSCSAERGGATRSTRPWRTARRRVHPLFRRQTSYLVKDSLRARHEEIVYRGTRKAHVVFATGLAWSSREAVTFRGRRGAAASPRPTRR
jgi:hypothetical protein